MRRVTQSITRGGQDKCEAGVEPGDCLRACVASIFELDLADVPHFCDTGPEHEGNTDIWFFALLGFIASLGAYAYTLTISRDHQPIAGLVGYQILSGPSPRADDGQTGLRHSVVGYGGSIVWDPHPSRIGLESIDETELIVPTTHHARVLLAKEPDA